MKYNVTLDFLEKNIAPNKPEILSTKKNSLKCFVYYMATVLFDILCRENYIKYDLSMTFWSEQC